MAALLTRLKCREAESLIVFQAAGEQWRPVCQHLLGLITTGRRPLKGWLTRQFTSINSTLDHWTKCSITLCCYQHSCIVASFSPPLGIFASCIICKAREDSKNQTFLPTTRHLCVPYRLLLPRSCGNCPSLLNTAACFHLQCEGGPQGWSGSSLLADEPLSGLVLGCHWEISDDRESAE